MCSEGMLFLCARKKRVPLSKFEHLKPLQNALVLTTRLMPARAGRTILSRTTRTGFFASTTNRVQNSRIHRPPSHQPHPPTMLLPIWGATVEPAVRVRVCDARPSQRVSVGPTMRKQTVASFPKPNVFTSCEPFRRIVRPAQCFLRGRPFT
jgi:hypothetical protein